jgi:hypothetical protein
VIERMYINNVVPSIVVWCHQSPIHARPFPMAKVPRPAGNPYPSSEPPDQAVRSEQTALEQLLISPALQKDSELTEQWRRPGRGVEM